MALNDVIANIINSQMTLFFEKLNEKYDIEISEMQEIWENMEGAPAPVKKGKAKKAKDPNAPKKPRSAYIFFSTEKRPIVKEDEPNLTFGELNKRLGEMWQEEKSKDSKEYKRFMKMAENEKENGRPVEAEKEKPKKAFPKKSSETSSDSESKAESNEEEKPKKGSSNKGKTVEKCSKILQTGKNKGNECGAPVKGKGLCGRHLALEEKEKNVNEEKKEEKKEEKPKKAPAKAPAKKPVKKEVSKSESESSGDEKPKKGEKKNKDTKGLNTIDIKKLDEKLTELDEGKLSAIVIRNTEKEKKINYYVLTAFEDEIYNVEGDLFAGEIELEEGCENDKEVVMAQLTKEGVQDFFTIDKGCDYAKIVKGLPKVF